MPGTSKRPTQRRGGDLRSIMTTAVGGETTDKAPAESPAAPEPEADARPAMQRRSDHKQQQGINWDTDLLLYARDVTARFKRAYPDEHIPTLAALVDLAVREKLAALEVKYNNGRAFPPLV